MKTKIAVAILLSTAALLSSGRAQDISLETARPVVIKSVPQSGADDVDPAMTEISVTFSKPMKAGSWSWAMIARESYPGTADAPKYLDDKKTCVLPVKLQPGKTYAVWVNSEKLQNFKDAQGNIAVPFLLVFKTRDK
jgi:Bacterial Ig-like domain